MVWPPILFLRFTSKRNTNLKNTSPVLIFIYLYMIYYVIKIPPNIKKKLLRWGQSWRSGTRCDCKTDWLWVRSPLKEMKYLLKFISAFLRSGVEIKRGVEFCHSTRNASRIRQKVGRTECLNIRFPLPTLLYEGYSVKLIFFSICISTYIIRI